MGIEVHAGHGLDYKTTRLLTKIIEIEEFNIGHFIIGESVLHSISKVVKEFNIGHFIIGESIFFGIKTVLKKFKKIIK